MAALKIDGLGKAYRDTLVLDALSLCVEARTLVAILGASGCGKTTLLRLICGFEQADVGSITIGKTRVCGPGLHVRPELRAVGYVAQDGALFPHLAVAENITFGLPWRQRRRRHRVTELLSMVGLPARYADRSPDQLSGGEQQRVALARALAPAPPLVLLDEPFSALDAGLRAETRQAVANALRASGSTALLVTHDQAEALSMGDAVAVLRDGVLVQMDDPQTLYRRPIDRVLARFLGEANLLPGKIMNGHVTCALGVLPLVASFREGSADVMVRPDQIRLGSRENGVPAKVETVAFYGRDCSVTLTLDGSPQIVTALVPGYAMPRTGDVVGLRVEGRVMTYPSEAATR